MLKTNTTRLGQFCLYHISHPPKKSFLASTNKGNSPTHTAGTTSWQLHSNAPYFVLPQSQVFTTCSCWRYLLGCSLGGEKKLWSRNWKEWVIPSWGNTFPSLSPQHSLSSFVLKVFMYKEEAYYKSIRQKINLFGHHWLWSLSLLTTKTHLFLKKERGRNTKDVRKKTRMGNNIK